MPYITNLDAARITDPTRRRYAYNALDGCLTRGVLDATLPQIRANPNFERVYRFERAFQAACMAVSIRGLKVDKPAAKFGVKVLAKGVRRATVILDRIAGWDFNPRSPVQVRRLLYEELGVKPRRKDNKITTDVDALTGIAAAKSTPKAGRMVARVILATRNWEKQRQVLAGKLWHGRMRTTLNVGGTSTFRLSSHSPPNGPGTNLQNITKRRRYVFVPDTGFIMVQMDQKKAESMIVAHASGDVNYIKAHAEGNAHVNVARMIWPGAAWPTDELEAEKFSKEPGFIRHFSRYDLAKKVQHGSNYRATKYMLARILQVSLIEADEIIEEYFATFPGIRKWQEAISKQVWKTGKMKYPGGYERQFLGRRTDPHTMKSAISSWPQSAVAFINHIVFWRLWYHLDRSFIAGIDGPDFQVLMHGHDAVLFQYREGRDDLLARAKELSVLEWPVPGGHIIMGWDFSTGKNWKECS